MVPASRLPVVLRGLARVVRAAIVLWVFSGWVGFTSIGAGSALAQERGSAAPDGAPSLEGGPGGRPPGGEAPGPGGPSGGRAPGGVGLDRLLELPSSVEYTVERRGGYTAGEWRQRFAAVRSALDEERAALEEAERRLDEVAQGATPWKVAPALPGMGSTEDAPLDYGLRQQIRRHGEEIARLERKLRDLRVEADLAGVPAGWRGPADGARPEGDAPARRPRRPVGSGPAR